MSAGDELDRERERRAGDTARRLLDVALGASDGDLEQALEQVPDEDAPAVLAAMVREVALLTATAQLRDFDLAADVEADAEPSDDAPAVPDDELSADPWATSEDAASNALEAAGALFAALAEQRTVPDLLRAIGALDESEAFAIVLERALREMAELQRPCMRREGRM